MGIIGVIIFFIIGLVLIIKGGDWFVDASTYIAEVTGIPSFIIGATIVSLATTLPELIVSLNASFQGFPDIAIGNAIGSTICNIGLISGIAIIAIPNAVNRKAFTFKSLLMVGSALVFIALSFDGVLSHVESLALFAILIGFVVYNLRQFKGSAREEKHEVDVSRKTKIENGLKFVLGAIFIVAGANLLVDNGILLARYFGIPEGIVALTFIALGTSLPELTTTISSIIKKNHDIGLGNIIGANILNITLILSTSSVASSQGLLVKYTDFTVFGQSFTNASQTLMIDVPISIVLMLLLTVPAIIFGRTKKWQGVLMLGTYIGYLGILVSML